MANNTEMALHFITSKCNKVFIKKLAQKTEKSLQKLGNVDITIGLVRKYWKRPGTYECFLSAKFSKEVTIKELMNLFNLNWYYHYSNYFDSDSTIWNKIDEPEKIFIDNAISWAHIYPIEYEDDDNKNDGDEKTLIIFDITEGIYNRGNTESTKLALLGDFLVEDVGTGQDDQFVKEILDKNKKIIKFICCMLTREKENLCLNYQFLPDYEDLIIPTKDLANILKKWNQLVNSGTKKIILSLEENNHIKIAEKIS